jgi:hypothetical protein
MTIEEIVTALRQTHRADISIIKKYIAWVAFRRRMNDQFFPAVHWVTGARVSYHWI